MMGCSCWRPCLLFALLATTCVLADERPSFFWGAATAAYQIEGGYNEGGRGLSVWDVFSHTPGKVANGDTGDVAVDFYHSFHEDNKLARSLGVRHFRMSISWPRIFPEGTGTPNPKGIEFYNKVINALLSNDITPYVTLYHWDLPQALHEKYLGWLSDEIVEDFANYAQTVFENFGDRVKWWTTFNEPLSFCMLGYGSGIHAPGRCSNRTVCPEGNSGVEPYIASHNVLLAHAEAVARFRKAVPDGKISMNLNSDWAEPLTDKPEDVEAAQRHLEFTMGIYADPLYLGDYPASVRQRLPFLPPFTPEQTAALRASSQDYFALNHYTTAWWVYDDNTTDIPLNSYNFMEQTKGYQKLPNGTEIGLKADSSWLYVVPWGFNKMLTWVHQRYNGPEIYVTENGVDAPNESQLPLEEVVKDSFRLNFYRGYIAEAMKAVKENGVKLRGYFAWSLFDNFEWADGYDKRFGMTYVNYSTQERTPKASVKWFASYFGTNEQPETA